MRNTKDTTGETILVRDLKREYKTFGRSVDRAVKSVLRKGWYILGEELRNFEDEFAGYNGSSYAVGVASGTEALQLSLVALSVGGQDEVITAVNTAIPTAMAIRSCGATPRFVDIAPGTFNMDAALIADAVTDRAKAIVPVHLYGNPCDMDAISKAASKRGLAIVEDCAQAHGAVYNGTKVGNFGKLGAFSFYPTKNLGCCGDGGLVVTNDKKLAKAIRLLRNYGQPSRYVCEIEGTNSRLDEIQAAILRIKLKRLDRSNKARREIAAEYGRRLKELKEIETPAFDKGCEHVFHLYVIRCEERDGLKKYLWSKGIETQIHYPIPLHLQKAFRHLGYKAGDFPVAEKLSGRVLSLPIFPELKASEVKKICGAIKDFYANTR